MLAGHFASTICRHDDSADGAPTKVDPSLWSLVGAEGELSADAIYEIHMTVADDSEYDANAAPKTITLSVMLVCE